MQILNKESGIVIDLPTLEAAALVHSDERMELVDEDGGDE